MKKKCSKCKQEKELSEFSKNKCRKDGYQSFCKECSKSNFHSYYDRCTEKFIAYKKKRKIKLKKIVYDIKSISKCYICGESHIATLDFHHRNKKEKEGNIIELIYRGVSEKKLLDEIKKCDIYCSNCHRKLHYENGTLGL